MLLASSPSPGPPEPPSKRVFAYVDAQNLFNAAKEAFDEFDGYDFPGYDPIKLTETICRIQSWTLEKLHIYTGLPAPSDPRHTWWNRKLQVLASRDVFTFARSVRYSEQDVTLKSGVTVRGRVAREKGVDVRIALDVVRHAFEQRYEVALIYSQDQDLSEAVADVKLIASQQDRWIKTASAFPVGASNISPVTGEKRNARGINGTKEIKIQKALYDACLDPRDYRLPLSQTKPA